MVSVSLYESILACVFVILFSAFFYNFFFFKQEPILDFMMDESVWIGFVLFVYKS